MRHLVGIHEGPGSVTVVLRPWRRWRVCVVLAPVSVGMVLLALAMMRAWGSSPGVEWLEGLLFDVAGGAAFGALLAAAWYTIGREIVTVAGGVLSIEHRLLRRGRKVRTYAAAEVENLRAVGLGQVMHRGRLVTPEAPAIAFDWRGETIRFGAGLEGAEAQAVLSALGAALERANASSTG